MGNLRSKYTDEEWDALLEEATKRENEAKEQAVKDMIQNELIEGFNSLENPVRIKESKKDERRLGNKENS